MAEAAPPITPSVEVARRPRRRSRRVTWGARVAMAYLALVLVAAVAAPWLAPHNPTDVDLALRLRPPAWQAGGSWAYPLGTDPYGRDILSRLIFGARVSVLVSLMAIVLGGVVGTIVGIVAGYAGGKVDVVLMRIADIVLSIPAILIAVALAVIVGPSIQVLGVVIAAFFWPRFARQVRVDAMAVRDADFVRYARIIHVPEWKIAIRHVLPSVLPTCLVLATLDIGQVQLLEAGLSFLGAAVPPPTPTWGGMIFDGSRYISSGWWTVVFPGLALVLMVASFNAFGEWLRVTLDPRMAKR